MKRVKSKMMRAWSIVLTAAMIVSMCGMPAVTAKATEATEAICNHVCDENCGGMQAVSGSAVTACTHVHDETCGYAEETAVAYEEIPDFSEAKELTEIDGVLYIDDVAVTSRIPAGNYKLGESITTNSALYTSGSVNLDLNGHTWNLSDNYLRITGTFSLYDTAVAQTGKITSSAFCTIEVQSEGSSFNLYSGTVENTLEKETALGVSCSWGGCNLYGGKIKSSAYAVEYCLGIEMIINLDGTVLECGEGYEQISAWLNAYSTPLAVIDVSDYTGTSLAVDAEIYKTGKIKIFQGIQSAQDAERYTVNVRCGTDFFLEKEEYGMEAGEMYVYVSEPSFTQQPTKENAYMVSFNHPDATLQWYEYNVLASNTYSQFTSPETIASYEVKAGDVLFATVDADDFQLRLSVGEEYFYLDEDTKTASIAFASDATINVVIDVASNASNLKLEHVRYTELAGENGVNLQNHECGTAYICKATVGGKVYYSDHVTTEHNGICTASGSVISKECSNCRKSGTLTVETEDGIYDGTTAYGATVKKTGILENEEVTVNYYQGDALIGTEAPVDAGTYTAKIIYEDVTVSARFKIWGIPTAEMFTHITSVVYDGTEKSANVVANQDITGMGEITVKYYQNDIEVTPINAGIYTVKIDAAEGDDYTDLVGLEIGTFEITKATPTADMFTYTEPTKLEFDGQVKEATVTTDKVGMGVITVKYSATPANAGTYTISIDVTEGDNYVAASGLFVGEFTIAKADSTVAAAPTSIADLVYDGTTQNLINAGTA